MYYVFGDIHGMADWLDVALEWVQARAEAEDTLVFLGDYIDRGPDSRRVLDTLLALAAGRPGTVILKGNHEDLLERALAEIDSGEIDFLNCLSATRTWLDNGGLATLESYGVERLVDLPERLPPAHRELIAGLPLEFMTDDFYFVHAGALPACGAWEGAESGCDHRLWIRDAFLDSDEDWGRLVVFGHTPQRGGLPLVARNKVGLDTAAIAGLRLSVGVFEPGNRASFGLFQVRSGACGRPVPVDPAARVIALPAG